MDAPRPSATFVVRIARSASGELIGSVQRALTGERRSFHRAEAIGPLIAEMVAGSWRIADEPQRPDDEVSP